jgi:hypothetical protein
VYDDFKGLFHSGKDIPIDPFLESHMLQIRFFIEKENVQVVLRDLGLEDEGTIFPFVKSSTDRIQIFTPFACYKHWLKTVWIGKVICIAGDKQAGLGFIGAGTVPEYCKKLREIFKFRRVSLLHSTFEDAVNFSKKDKV